jgi:hypothetical protein
MGRNFLLLSALTANPYLSRHSPVRAVLFQRSEKR